MEHQSLVPSQDAAFSAEYLAAALSSPAIFEINSFYLAQAAYLFVEIAQSVQTNDSFHGASEVPISTGPASGRLRSRPRGTEVGRLSPYLVGKIFAS